MKLFKFVSKLGLKVIVIWVSKSLCVFIVKDIKVDGTTNADNVDLS